MVELPSIVPVDRGSTPRPRRGQNQELRQSSGKLQRATLPGAQPGAEKADAEVKWLEVGLGEPECVRVYEWAAHVHTCS